MKEKAYIFTKEKTQAGTIFKNILNLEFTVNIPDALSGDKETALEKIMTEKFMKKHYEEEKKRYGSYSEKIELLEIKPVFMKKRSRYYEGEYFAHEYGKRVPGKVRKLEYSNGFYEYEVKCEDKTLSVLDGIYSEEERFGDRYNNGCGDYLETYEQTPWRKKELKKNKKSV